MSKRSSIVALGMCTLACGQLAWGVNYDTRYSASTGHDPSPTGAWPNYAISGEPGITVGSGDAAYLQCIDNNLRESGSTEPGYKENIGMYATRKIDLNENWWFESNIRVLSTTPKLDGDPDAFTLGADVVDQGAGNHGFVQLWWYAGADRVAGGTGVNQDKVVVTTLDDPSPTTSAQNLITADADFTDFHRYALQRDYASGQIQLFIDGKNAGSRALADFSDYPPPAYNDGANYQDLPGTGAAGRAAWDLRNHDLSLGQGVRRSWEATGGGDWSTAGNWFSAVPDATNVIADFGRAITSAAAINLDSARSVGGIAFDSPFGYTIGGSATLTLDGSTNTNPHSRIDSYTGHHTILPPVSLNSTIELWVFAGSTLSISGQMTVINPPGARVTKFGDGMLELKNVRASEIEVNSGTVRILPDGTTDGLSGVNLISIGGATDAWTGKLDLENNSIIADYAAEDPSPVSTIRNYIQNGRAGGAWNGNGVTSSAAAANPGMALGYGEAGVIFPAGGTFMTVPVDADMVLIRYTLAGDTDLDGKVNTIDFNNLAGGFGAMGTGDWVHGDFNYDSNIDSTDFSAMVANFGSVLPGAAAISGSVVPEPTCIGVLGLLLAAGRSSRRKSKSMQNRASQI